MTLRIEISPETEARLKEAASVSGIDEAEYARQLIENNLAPKLPLRDQATLDLLAKWREEDEAATPEEIALAEKEWEEFRAAMNEHATSGHPIYP